ncbi:DUF481 domain-containing protein [Oleiharenicola lentus]|uniref:DUF481 domain-containing protein n=1 Tax=Oleiharenicola lentus TaxID=2508720 RepID=UPI003F675B11
MATPALAKGVAAATEPEASTRDVLVFKDGDRVQGKLVAKEGETLVFQSDRFGELRVSATGAVVIKAEKPAETAVAGAKLAPAKKPAPAAKEPPPVVPVSAAEQVATAEKKAADHADAEKISMWERFSPAVLTAKMREFFGPWRGKFAVSTEVVADTTERAAASAELQLKRKWKNDEVALTMRYDYSQTEDVATTDTFKANGLWRHEYKERAFALYRPTVEWNRASFKSGVPADYLLLQQEIGIGLRLVVKPSRTVRVGVSENLFDTWGMTAIRSHTSRTIESAFVEAELKLPWRITLTDRSVYYYAVSSGDSGWENNFELSKRFTETLSTAIRHEIRSGTPDSRVQDYTRLKLMIGLDF